MYAVVNVANRLALAGRSGQSLGKRVLDIRLESAADGIVVGVGPAFAREVVHVLDQFMMLGCLRPLWDPERRTFADGLMSTRVVSNSLRWAKVRMFTANAPTPSTHSRIWTSLLVDPPRASTSGSR